MSGEHEPAELPEGHRLLDRYTIMDRVGSGGMASIYRAMDDRLDRVVCVKLLRLVLEGGSTGGRNVYQATYSHFLQEALALSKLQHPNTLRIYDFGYLPSSNRPFQISEFLDGGNLETRVKGRGAVSREETSAILERISGAVDEAHQHQIIHRDIKPSNILFGRVGELLMPKLADFGIAHSNLRKRPRAGESDEDAEAPESSPISTVTLFSPRWAAPEQLSGTVQGPVTDVYALGLTVVYMLAGRPLFEGNDVRGTFADRIRSDALVTRLLGEMGFTGGLAEVLRCSMAAAPEDRYPSAGAFFLAIRPHLQRAVAAAPSPSPAIPRPTPPRSMTPQPAPAPVTASQAPAAASTPPQPPAPVPSSAPPPRVRVVDVQEKLDLTSQGPRGDVRFRVTFVPAPDGSFRLNVKGLNCFVRIPGGRPTSAIVVSADGEAELVSPSWEALARIAWSFGEARDAPGHAGAGTRVFRVEGTEMVIPLPAATPCAALWLGREREVIVVCRRT